MRKIYFLILASILSLVGCEDVPTANHQTELNLITETTIYFEEVGGAQEARFSVNKEWSAEVVKGSEWCALDKYMGHEGGEIVLQVSATANRYTQARVAEILIVCQEHSTRISVSQSSQPVLEVAMDTTRFVSAGETTQILFNANKDWTVEVVEGQDWLHIATSSGQAGDNVVADLVVAKNEGATRQGKVNVNCGTLSQEVVFIQNPRPAQVEGDVSNWQCFITTLGDTNWATYPLVSEREFKVTLFDDQYEWLVYRTFTVDDLGIRNGYKRPSGTSFYAQGMRMGPGDPDITGTISVYMMDKVTGEILYDEPATVELTLYSDGRLADAANGEYVTIGNLQMYDRNLGANVPTAEEVSFAPNYSNEFPDVNPEFKGDHYDWHIALESAPEGWRVPSVDECRILKDRLIYTKGRYFIADDSGEFGSYMPLAGHENNTKSINGEFWSNARSGDVGNMAQYLGMANGGSVIANGNMYDGQSVRVVRTVNP